MSEIPTVDTSWEMKWMRSLRKRAINILARIENDRKPTQELHYELRKAMEAFTYWNSDTADWVKHTHTFPTKDEVNESLVKENN